VDELVELYFTSVGRNSKLLLNVPPTRDGILHDTDVARLAGMRARLDALFRTDLAAGRRVVWRATGARSATLEIGLGAPVRLAIADLREDITRGQIVARYALEGLDGERWRPLSRGTTIGYRKLDRFEPAAVRRVRLTIEEALEPPRPVGIRLYDR
jgi:alpha-L-fucosidase